MSDGRFGYVPNLHVILDGENRARAGTYLPFGIELVRKLIRQGRYANSKTVAVDDAVITARVVGEQRWLRIWVGGRCELYLESGIVDIGSLGPANPAFNDNGKLYLNPALEAMPELNGRLKLPLAVESPAEPISGDVAESFKKKIVLDELGNETVDPASLSDLQAKKLTVALVPPSLFTGKTRLYVQAIYGRRLKYFKNWSANLAFQPPALRYSGVSAGTSYAVDISTNCGVFTTEDYNYFLLQVMGGSEQYVTVRKLEAESACVEAARAYLVKNKDSLTDEKKTALEAYILSGSYPSDEIKFNLDAIITTNWQLGYGWHFNWSGTACDIVEHTPTGSGASTRYSAKHYRMEFARDKDKTIPASSPPLSPVQQERMRWAAIKQTTVEAQEWKNNKWQQVIAYPNWDTRQLQVFGNILGDELGSEAPVYCFYNKDVLRMLRYSYSGGAIGSTWVSESAPRFWRGSCSGTGIGSFPCTGNLYGTDTGVATLREYAYDAVNTAFSVGETAITAISRHADVTHIRKENFELFGGSHSFAAGAFGSGTHYFSTGDPVQVTAEPCGCETGVATYVQQGVLGPFSASNTYRDKKWESVTALGSEDYGHLLLSVIPVGDAEAVYVSGQQTYSWNVSGDREYFERVGAADAGIYSCYTTVVTSTGMTITHKTPQPTGVFTPVNTEPYTAVISAATPLGAYAVTGAGVFPFAMGSYGPFQGGEGFEQVEQSFYTLTSAGESPSSDGEGYMLTGGYAPALDAAAKVFVGHA